MAMTNGKKTRAAKGTAGVTEVTGGYVRFIGNDVRIPVPDDPAGERAAVAAHPEYQRRRAAALRADAEGRSQPIEEAFAELEAELEAEEKGEAQDAGRAPAIKRRGRPAAGAPQGRFVVRVPSSVHRELIDRAAREHTTLNQLVLSYISRGLGQDAGAG